VLRFINNRIIESPTEAHFVKSYANSNGLDLLNTNIREDAVMLDTLIQVDPKHIMIPKLVSNFLSTVSLQITFSQPTYIVILLISFQKGSGSSQCKEKQLLAQHPR
jgi:hypothetical protein